jgi:Zn-finger nucleic acid-binding protein
MSGYYESIDPGDDLVCVKCSVSMVKGRAMFEYMGSAFPVELPICPKCGAYYVPESLALDKILRVEKSLEDK